MTRNPCLDVNKGNTFRVLRMLMVLQVPRGKRVLRGLGALRVLRC